MNAARLLIIGLPFAVVAAFGQKPKDPQKFALFKLDESCVCIQTQNLTQTARATEVQTANSFYQVFWSRTIPNHELFRVRVGDVFRGDVVKWWNYGVADEGDYNGDGLPDYSWYGGDDTSEHYFIFLSSDGNYRRVDVIKTVQKAWQQRFHETVHDLDEVAGEHYLGEVALERAVTGLILEAEVKHRKTGRPEVRSYRFRIRQSDFIQ
jgi:hypothetical protein